MKSSWKKTWLLPIWSWRKKDVNKPIIYGYDKEPAPQLSRKATTLGSSRSSFIDGPATSASQTHKCNFDFSNQTSQILFLVWRSPNPKVERGLRVRNNSKVMTGDDVTKDLEDQPRQFQGK